MSISIAAAAKRTNARSIEADSSCLDADPEPWCAADRNGLVAPGATITAGSVVMAMSIEVPTGLLGSGGRIRGRPAALAIDQDTTALNAGDRVRRITAR